MGLLDQWLQSKGYGLNPGPASMALMGMGANMLAAGGPSATPSNFGSVMGAGLSGAVEGVNAQRAFEMQEALRQSQVLQNQAMAQRYAQLSQNGGFDPSVNMIPGGYKLTPDGRWFEDPRTGHRIVNRYALTDAQMLQYDPELQGEIADAKSRNEWVEVITSDGRKGYVRRREIYAGPGGASMQPGRQSAPLSKLPRIGGQVSSDQVLEAIAGVETGGEKDPWNARNKNSSARGRYQVTEGTAMTPWFSDMDPLTDWSKEGQKRWAENAFDRLLEHFDGDVISAISAWKTGPFAKHKDYEYVSKVIDRIALAPGAVRQASVYDVKRMENQADIDKQRILGPIDAQNAGMKKGAEKAAEGSAERESKRMLYSAFDNALKDFDEGGIIDKMNVSTGGPLGVAGYASMLTNPKGVQTFDAAKSQLSSMLRALYRIPGEGALSDKEMEMYSLQLPDIRNHPEVNRFLVKKLRDRARIQLGLDGERKENSNESPEFKIISVE